MTPLWVVIGLIIAVSTVSTLGAGFSVVGLSALFSGAALAVGAMAMALEFAKFVLSAYLHQRWGSLNIIFRSYLTVAIIVLSVITSMGIFGFLSNAYQSSSVILDAELIKLESLKTQQARNAAEIARINKGIDEIPITRISRKMKVRSEAEPVISDLTKESEKMDITIADTNLRILDVKQKVGPLIYIAKIFNVDIDTIVKYLTLILIFVFDPLAICLVIATSEALNSRRPEYVMKERRSKTSASGSNPALPKETPPDFNGEEVIQMRFVDDKDQSTG